MKRNGGILTFSIIMLSSLVSAGPVEGLEKLLEGARDMILLVIRFITNILLDIDNFDELLFAKLLILLIIFFVVYTVIKKNRIFGTDQKIISIISSAISILSIRYLPEDFVQAILLQYNIFAMAVTTLIPFMLFFFFIHQSGFKKFGRRMGWIFYAITFIAIWAFRYDDIGNANYIYWVGIIFVVISLIFDSSIHKYFELSDFQKAHSRIKQEAKWKLEESANLYAERLQKGIITPEQYKEKIKDIEKQIKAL
jgi:hypothetical protein